MIHEIRELNMQPGQWDKGYRSSLSIICTLA